MAIENLAACRPHAISFVLGCICILLVSPSMGHADFITDPDRYCSAGSDQYKTEDTVTGGNLWVNDVTLTIATVPTPQSYVASDCYGDFDPGDSGWENETSALDQIFGDGAGFDPLLYLDKTGEDSDDIGLGGITFVVEHTSGGVDGAVGYWTVTWTDSNGIVPQNLPITVDFALLLNGGNNNAAYLLTNVLLPISPTYGTGTFDIQFLNQSGKNEPTISHLTLAGRLVSTPRIIEVPEPTSAAIFGSGLLGLLALRRRLIIG